MSVTRGEAVDYTDPRYEQEYIAQYGTDIGNAPPAIHDAAMAREQDKEDAKWQEINARRNVIGKTSTKATGAPQNVPIPEGQVAASVNTKRTNAFKLVKALVDALQLKRLNIQVFNTKDLTTLIKQLYAKSPILGVAFETRLAERKLPAMLAFVGDQIFLYYDDSYTDAEIADAIGHEMGHVVFRALLNQERMRNTPLWNRIYEDYRRSGTEQRFMEWFADEVRTWAVNKGKVQSAKGAFLKRVVDAIQRILKVLGLKPTPGAVSAYLDGLVLREKTLEQDAFLKGLQGTAYDTLTFAQTVNHSAQPLLHIPYTMDFLTLDGVKKGAVQQWLALMNRLPLLRQLSRFAHSAGQFAHDHLATMNSWLRTQGVGEMTLLANLLDNQPRGADQVELLSDEIIRQRMQQLWTREEQEEAQRARREHRTPTQLTQDRDAVLEDLLMRAAALRAREGVLGVDLVTWLDPNLGMAKGEVVPVQRESFTEAVRREYNGEWGAGYRNIVFGQSEADLKKWGVELLRNDPQSSQAKAIKAYLDRFYQEYLVPRYTGPHSSANGEPVVHIGRLENWGLARYYSPDAVAADSDGFIRLLTTEDGEWTGMSLADARAFTDRIIKGNQLLDVNDTDSVFQHTFSPEAKSKKARELTIPIDKLLPYLEQRVDKVLDSYVHSMIKRAEWDRRFGEEVKVDNTYIWKQGFYTDLIKQGILYNHSEIDAQRSQFLQQRTHSIIEAYLGRYGTIGMDPRARATLSYTQMGANYLVMPFSLLSQFPDMVGPLTRMGGGSKEYFKGLRETFKALRDKQNDLWKAAELMGVVFRDTKNLGAAALFDQQYMTEGAQRGNDLLFKYNGMQLFNNFSRMVSWQTSKYWLESLLTHKDQDRLLSQVGLTKDDVIAWRDSGYKEYTAAEGQNSVAYKIAVARMRFVNESVFSPHAGQRPLWANHPYMNLIWHLKQFAYSYYEQLLKPALREVRDNPALYGKLMAVLPLALMFPLAMAGMALRDELKQGLLPWRTAPRPSFDKDADGWVSEMGKLVSRTGILGPIQLILDADRSSSWGRSFTFALLGPTATKLEEFAMADDLMDGMLRMTPGLSMLPQERQALMSWWRSD